uniref:(California timema) hypothetical protein n=1 Tax=Timema californicum TaxID=61474 RepID=A0A7R9PAA6_TIMCA|nr:unnamed protein product [Timema californicum]
MTIVEDRDSGERLHNPWPPPSNHYYEPEEDQSNQIYQPHGPQASRSEYSPRRVTGSLARPRGHPRITTGLYHTSQWGTARIPYRGAVVKVPVVGESHKVTFYLIGYILFGASKRNGILAGESKRNGILSGASKRNYILSGASKRNYILSGASKRNYILSGASKRNGVLSGASKRNDILSGASKRNYILSGASKRNGILSGASKRNDILSGVSKRNDILSGASKRNDILSGASKRNDILSGASKRNDQSFWEPLTHKGTVTTTILNRRQASTRYSKGIPGYAVQDASVEDQVCVRCPVDRTVVASRGTDFVFMPHSKLKKCKHRPRVPGAKWEYLYGPRPGSIITEGSHVVAGRALYNHKQLQQCQYRYTVLVRKCPPLMLPKYVDAHCSRGNVWGSECELVCHQGYQLRGHNVTACGDQLMWTNPLPQCSVTTDCPLPMSPSHGRLSCHTPDGSVSSDLLPEGSVCRYMCDEGYSVPESESHLLVTLCTAAEWNSTADPSCQSTQQYFTDNTQPQVGQYQRDAVHHTVRVRHRAHTYAVTHR